MNLIEKEGAADGFVAKAVATAKARGMVFFFGATEENGQKKVKEGGHLPQN